MENIGKRRAKLALITLGLTVVISSPIIIIGSIYGYNKNVVSIEQKKLNDFFEQEEGSLFQKNNFQISQPKSTPEGKFLVENVTINNVLFLPIERLRNFSYNIEIVEIIPKINEATLKFKYKIYSITDSSIQVTRESESYTGFVDSFQNFHIFSK